ncbi:hypothetical protein [Ilumatobacter sp.]|uniref:hypothetical protein n=1 Tax=Ilumatobacter sp. TaxID=1967498 RepID=UPI003B52F9A7
MTEADDVVVVEGPVDLQEDSRHEVLQAAAEGERERDAAHPQPADEQTDADPGHRQRHDEARGDHHDHRPPRRQPGHHLVAVDEATHRPANRDLREDRDGDRDRDDDAGRQQIAGLEAGGRRGGLLGVGRRGGGDDVPHRPGSVRAEARELDPVRSRPTGRSSATGAPI